MPAFAMPAFAMPVFCDAGVAIRLCNSLPLRRDLVCA
jgi:hypothetical protein